MFAPDVHVIVICFRKQARYEGSIWYAKCSEAADAVSIRREIGDKVDEVDHAIHVLMAAGMSSPALRDIARSVDIEHAAFPEIIGALFLLGPFATDSLSLTVVCLFYYGDVWYRDALITPSFCDSFYLLCCVTAAGMSTASF